MTSELRRRVVHAAGCVFPLAYLAGWVAWQELRVIYLLGAGLALGLEVLRLVVGLDWRLMRELTREYEQANPAGYALYVFGAAAAVVAFEPRIAVPAVLMLAFADPASGLVGADELRGLKRPSALLVAFVVSLLVAWPFVPPAVAVLGALATTVADGAKPVVAGYVIDDNLTIPIGAAAVMWLGVQYLPG